MVLGPADGLNFKSLDSFNIVRKKIYNIYNKLYFMKLKCICFFLITLGKRPVKKKLYAFIAGAAIELSTVMLNLYPNPAP